ncbi:MAG: DNA-processing protein DprA [Clostridiales bacterium]|nr:DNA-processing protein DprA [Clostridiales bacterium]
MRSLSNSEKAIIFLDGIEKLEYKHKKFILDSYNSPEDIFADNRLIDEYFNRIGKSETAKQIKLLIKDSVAVEEIVERAIRGSSDVITYKDQRYPKELINTPTPPLCLYAVGNVDLLKERKVGIVGSRKTLNQYAKLAEDISKRLTENGIVVVTGIAEGGDYASIKGGLESGRVISVFAGDVVNVYPVRNRDLASKLLANGGLVLAEHPYGVVPRNYFYPIRNRIIAGLSQGVLIVSGEQTSGARYTADYAIDYGREVFCLPYGLGVKSGELCKKLVKNGATMVESAEEIAQCLNFELNKKEEVIGLDEKEKALYKLIKEGVSSTDELAEKSGIPIYEIISALLTLELKGFIAKDSGGNCSAIK